MPHLKPAYCPAEYDPSVPAPDKISSPAEFVQTFLPVAIEVQKETGIPASYMIAQAAFESAWGTSYAYTKLNNLFGYACGYYHQDWRALDPPLQGRGDGKTVSVEVQCVAKRLPGEGGYYNSFRTKQESFWAIAYLLLNDPAAARWSYLRNLLAQNQPPHAISPSQVLSNIPGYQTGYTDAVYASKIQGTINYLGLERYDLCY